MELLEGNWLEHAATHSQHSIGMLLSTAGCRGFQGWGLSVLVCVWLTGLFVLLGHVHCSCSLGARATQVNGALTCPGPCEESWGNNRQRLCRGRRQVSTDERRLTRTAARWLCYLTANWPNGIYRTTAVRRGLKFAHRLQVKTGFLYAA